MYAPPGMSRDYQNPHGKSEKVTHPGTNFGWNCHGIHAYVTRNSPHFPAMDGEGAVHTND